jgi:hypothetical protein
LLGSFQVPIQPFQTCGGVGANDDLALADGGAIDLTSVSGIVTAIEGVEG